MTGKFQQFGELHMLVIIEYQLHRKFMFGLIDTDIDRKQIMEKGEHHHDHQQLGDHDERRFHQLRVIAHNGKDAIYGFPRARGVDSIMYDASHVSHKVYLTIIRNSQQVGTKLMPTSINLTDLCCYFLT